MELRAGSLFLICNPGWLLTNGDKGINELYRAYKMFGKAIGPDNLAVWLSWSSAPEDNEPEDNESVDIDHTDIERMSTYCVKFNLLPSQTPQVVTTTKYPDDPDVGGKVVVNLSGDARDSAHALTALTDELLKKGLNQPSLDNDEWGHRVATVASTVVGFAYCYLNKVSISIKTGAFNAEIAHASTPDQWCHN